MFNVAYVAKEGEMIWLIRQFDWARTTIGPSEKWPASLRISLGTILHSPLPMLLFWGEEFICFYNDAFRPSLGNEGRHPNILGQRGAEAWNDTWHYVGPMIKEVYEKGTTVSFEDHKVPIYRNGKIEDVYWTFSYSPVRDEEGNITGVLVVCNETSPRVTKFHNLVEQVKTPVVIYKGEDLIIEEANGAALEIWKVGKEIIGKPFLEVLPQMRGREYTDQIFAVLRSGEKSNGLESAAHFVNRKDGRTETVYFNYEFSPYREANGEISGVMVVASDVTQQVVARQHLAIAEDEMRIAIQAADLGYWNLDPLTNKLSCNEYCRLLFGLPLEGDVDLSVVISAVHEEDRNSVLAAMEKALNYDSGGNCDVVCRAVNPSTGRMCFIEAKGKAYFNEDKIAYRFSGILQDVTQSKEDADELKYQKLLLETVTENTDMALFLMDERQYCVYMNEAAEVMTGFKLEELKGKQLHNYIHHTYPDGRHYPLEECPIDQALPTQKRMKGEEVFVHRDGSHYSVAFTASPIIVDGKATGTVIEVRETTEEKKREQALEKSEERLRIAIKGGELGLFDHFPQTGEMIWSVRTKEMFGLPPDAKINFDVYLGAIHPDDREKSAALIRKAFQPKHGGRYENEYRVIGITDGKTRWVRSIGSIFFDGDGKALRFTGIIQDITTQKQAAEALQFSNERFELVAKATQDAIWDWNLESNEIWWSEGFKSLFGYRHEEVEPGIESWYNRVHPDDKERIIGGIHAVIDHGGKTWTDQYRFRKADGSYAVVLDRGYALHKDGKPFRMLGSMQDVTARHLFEAALVENEKRFRDTFENAAVGIAHVALDGKWLMVNERLCEIVGYTREEMLAANFQKITHPDDLDADLELLQKTLEGKTDRYTLDKRYIHKDGRIIWINLTVSLIRNDDGTPHYFISIVKDITQEKDAEGALIRSEEKYRSLFQTMDQGFCIIEVLFDGRDEGFDYRFLEYNERFSEQSGLKDAIGKTMRELVPDIEDKWPQTYGRVAKTHEAIRFTEGSAVMNRWFEVYTYKTGEPDSNLVAVLFTDVTDRKVSEERITRSEERFRSLANAMPQLVWVAEPNGDITYYNDYVALFEGATKRDDGTWSWEGLLHPDDVEGTLAAWRDAIDRKVVYERELRVRLKNAGYRWYLSRAIPQYNEDGHLVKWFGTSTDIHHQKTFSEQMEELVGVRTRELQRSNEDLQQFAHVASHDLKEPLRKIKTFSDRMKEEFSSILPDRAAAYLTKIEKGADRMYDMIDGVLLYSSMEAIRETAEEVDLNDIMQNIQNDLEIIINKKGAVIKCAVLPPVEGVPVLLHQLFYNLINNSLKFAKNNITPRISITAEEEMPGSQLTQYLPSGKTYVRIRLEDNGIGFDQNDAEKIFKTFARLNPKDKYEGTGLGLSLCNKIVERHNGKIWAEGKPGEGAVFNMLLPVFK